MRVETVCLGRLHELKTRPDAELLAVRTPDAIFGEYQVMRYKSRKALETFLKNPGKWRAVVFNKVPRGMATHAAYQVETTP